MLGAKLTGSEVKYVLGLSAVALAAAGSSAAFNSAGFTYGTLLFQTDSAGATANVLRSATSNGTFTEWGASLTGVASKLAVRSFQLSSSNTWLKLHHDNVAGSATGVAIVSLQGAMQTPVNQESTTNVFSTVLS
jgi:hypothetical protein